MTKAEYQREWRRKLRAERLEQGWCTECGKARPAPNVRRCEMCRVTAQGERRRDYVIHEGRKVMEKGRKFVRESSDFSTAEKIYCGQCTMSLRRENRPRAKNYRCPDCKRPFWEAMTAKKNLVICGVSDRQATEWEDEVRVDL